jgi:hypothetical protein
VEKQVVFMLLLTSANMVSDIWLVVVLLHSSQAAFGVASLVILSVSIVVQVIVVKYYGRMPWLSKDTLLTAVCLGPALEAYRQIAGEPAGHQVPPPPPRFLVFSGRWRPLLRHFRLWCFS